MSDFEQIELDPANSEARMTRSDYAQVIFRNVAETYTIDTDVDVLYTVTRYHSPSKRDWVGLYKVGWTSSRDHLYYHWAVIPKSYQQGAEYEAKLTFAGSTLPKDDGEFYQFCYVTSSGQVRGASTPFQFKHPSAQEFIEVMDSDNDIMVIKSKTSALEEQLKEVQNEKEEVLRQKCRVEKEMQSFISKLMEVEKSVASEKQEKDALRVDLQATQDKVASLHSEVKDKTARHEKLKADYEAAKEENAKLQEQLEELDKQHEKLQDELKVLKNDVDQLNGKNRSLEEEKNLYKEHFNTSSDTLKEHNVQMEIMKKQRLKDEEELKSMREAALQLEREVQTMKKQSERQSAVSDCDKKHIGDLRTQIQALNEQIEALQECKLSLGKEVDTLMQAHDKMAKDMEASTSEAFTLKEQLKRLEDSKQRLQKTMEGEVKFLQGKLDEKQEENVKVSTENAKLTEAINKRQGDEGSMFALQMAHDELKKRLGKAENLKNSLEKEVAELHKRKTIWEVKEKEMRREIEDLKERLLMGQEEFKDKYIECKRLQQQLKKAQKVSVVYSRDNSTSAEPSMSTKMTETPRKSENEQTTQTTKSENERTTQTAKAESERTTQTSKAESERTTQTSLVEKKDNEQMTSDVMTDLSSEEIQAQLAELGQELENRCAKKLKYKRLYQEEKEKNSFVQKHYHEQIERKEKELDELRRKMREQEDQHLQYVRKMEEVERENMRHKQEILSLRNMLVEKPQVRQPPKIPPRPSRPGEGAKSPATIGYGSTEGAQDIIKKVNSIASERSSQKEPSITEVKKKAAESAKDEDQASVLTDFDPVLQSEKNANDNEPNCVLEEVNGLKQGKASGSSFETRTLTSSEPDIKRPPKQKPEDVPPTNVATNGVKQAEGSTIPCASSQMQVPSPVSIDREASSDVNTTGPARGMTDRQSNLATGDEQANKEQDQDEFFDAKEPAGALSCPVCNLIFPPNTDETILNAHVNIHLESIPDPPMKDCPMCPKQFPNNPEKQAEFEAHVNTHLDAEDSTGNYV